MAQSDPLVSSTKTRLTERTRPFPHPYSNSFVPFELDFHLVVDLFIEHSNRISYLI